MKKVKDVQDKYINLLLEISKIKDIDELNQKFNKVYLKYSKFCYKHKINDRIEELLDSYKNIFLFPCTPLMYDIDNKELNNIIDKLQNTNTNQQEEGLTEEEAIYLLKGVVKGVRDELSKQVDIENASLSQTCGYAQAISYYLLNSIDIKTTLNNASNLPDSNTRHAFLTCFLPIKKDNEIIYKQYLIDATYRQFFLTINCNQGNFYTADERFKHTASPHPGYFINKSLETKNIARELLENGFLELTPKNILMYGSAFSFSSITLYKNKKEISKITSHSPLEYLDSINNKDLQVEVDYTKEELVQYNCNINLRNIGNLMHK